MFKRLFSVFLVVLFLFPTQVFAHPGGLRDDGSHACWTNCAYWGLEVGEVHFHNSSDNTYTNSKGDLFGSSGTLLEHRLPFSDLAVGHWAYSNVRHLYNKSIINGYADNTFKPNNSITRGEAIKMIVAALGVNTSSYNSNFSDVKPNSWAYPYVSYAASSGITTGYPDNTFGLSKPITRVEIATFLQRAYQFSMGPTPKTFSDVPVTHWAYQTITVLSSNSIITGYQDNTFRPNNLVTRAEFSAMLARILK